MKGLFITALASLSPFPPAYGSSSGCAQCRWRLPWRGLWSEPGPGPLVLCRHCQAKDLLSASNLARFLRDHSCTLYYTHSEVCGYVVKAPFKYSFHVQSCSCRDTDSWSERLLCTFIWPQLPILHVVRS